MYFDYINPFYLNKSQGFEDAILSPMGEAPGRLFSAVAQRKLKQPEPIDKILAVVTDQVDLRMLVQLSAFTVHGTRTPLEEFGESNKFVMRFEIPEAAKARLCEELTLLGIREGNVFPDLEHLANELSSWATRLLSNLQPSQ